MVQVRSMTYVGARERDRGMKKMQKKGWQVVKVEVVDRGWGCLKTVTLAVLFFPLALLGKRPVGYLVMYRRET